MHYGFLRYTGSIISNVARAILHGELAWSSLLRQKDVGSNRSAIITGIAAPILRSASGHPTRKFFPMAQRCDGFVSPVS